jgi:glycosyltransferase involved in cell wall biosynthesis
VKIGFVLPPDFGIPIGGYAVVYEYANRLADRGHEVSVLHLEPDRYQLRSMSKEHLRHVARSARHPVRWFPLDPRVATTSAPRLTRSEMSADRLIATGWRTADPVARATHAKGGGYYLIQHFEDWDGPRSEVEKTWRLPLHKLVISEWLEDKAEELGAAPVTRLPNGIDASVYAMSIEPEARERASVAMLWHESEWKGSTYGLRALTEVRRVRPELRAHLFSVSPKPPDLPTWVTWHAAPKGREVADIYNSVSIFVSPSLSEGWPLPPAEAMSCGAALLSTDIPGVSDYAHDRATAILVPPRSSEALADAVLMLIRDDELRVSLALAGRELITSTFTWERATDRLEAALSTSSPEVRA